MLKKMTHGGKQLQQAVWERLCGDRGFSWCGGLETFSFILQRRGAGSSTSLLNRFDSMRISLHLPPRENLDSVRPGDKNLEVMSCVLETGGGGTTLLFAKHHLLGSDRTGIPLHV